MGSILLEMALALLVAVQAPNIPPEIKQEAIRIANQAILVALRPVETPGSEVPVVVEPPVSVAPPMEIVAIPAPKEFLECGPQLIRSYFECKNISEGTLNIKSITLFRSEGPPDPTIVKLRDKVIFEGILPKKQFTIELNTSLWMDEKLTLWFFGPEVWVKRVDFEGGSLVMYSD